MLNQLHGNANNLAATRPFNCVKAMHEHLGQRQQVEDFVSGQSRRLPDVPAACDADCRVGKWLHSENGKSCKNITLIDSLCNSCAEFREAVSQVVLLACSGNRELAQEAVLAGKEYSVASEEFQHNLVEFNLRSYA